MKLYKPILIFICFIIAFSFSACSKNASTLDTPPKLAINEQSIFYSDGTANTVRKLSISADSIDDSEIFLEDERVDSQIGSYMFTTKGGMLRCYSIETEPQLLFEIEKPDKYAVLENMLYFIRDNILYSLDTAGGQQAKVDSDRYIDLKAEAGRIWLITKSHNLKRLSGTQMSDALLTDINIINDFTVIDKTIYYLTKSDTGYRICCKDFDTMQTDVLLDNIERFYGLTSVNKFVYATVKTKGSSTDSLMVFEHGQSGQSFFTLKSDIPSTDLKAFDSIVSYGAGIVAMGNNTSWQAEGDYCDMQAYGKNAVFMLKDQQQDYFFEITSLQTIHNTILP